MRYFKKSSANVPLFLQDGSRVMFERVGGNVGVLATEDGYTAQQMVLMASEGRGGVSEISQADYEALKKNSQNLTPPWREEISKQGMADQARRLRQTAPLQAATAAATEQPRGPAVMLGGAQNEFRPEARKTA